MLLKKVDDLILKDINFSYKKNFSSQKILENFNYVIKKENLQVSLALLVQVKHHC